MYHLPGESPQIMGDGLFVNEKNVGFLTYFM